MRDPELRVLESFKPPRKTTNPYIVMLYSALQKACDIHAFSWREALRGDYDVFHVHWPEVLLRSDRRSRRVGRRVAFWLFWPALSPAVLLSCVRCITSSPTRIRQRSTASCWPAWTR